MKRKEKSKELISSLKICWIKMFLQVIAIAAHLASLAEGSFFVISDLHYDILYKDDYNQTYYCHNLITTTIQVLNQILPPPTSSQSSVQDVIQA
jgi:hypothetical protein